MDRSIFLHQLHGNIGLHDEPWTLGTHYMCVFLKIQYVKHGNHPWVWVTLTLSNSASYSYNKISSRLVCGMTCFRHSKVTDWRKVCEGKFYQISLSNFIFMTKPKACFTVISEMAVCIMTFIEKVFPNKGILLLCHIHITLYLPLYLFFISCCETLIRYLQGSSLGWPFCLIKRGIQIDIGRKKELMWSFCLWG